MRSYIGTYNAKKNLEPIVEVEMRRLLLRMLSDPDDMIDHIRV